MAETKKKTKPTTAKSAAKPKAKTTAAKANVQAKPKPKAQAKAAPVKKAATKAAAPAKPKKEEKNQRAYTFQVVKSSFKPEVLQRFRSILDEERERLRQELEEIEARAARAIEIEAASELSDYDDHPADVASETFEREKDLAIAENTASLLAKVENAIGKLERGTYGVCDICRRPIKKARLDAIPFATLCIECQGRVEIG